MTLINIRLFVSTALFMLAVAAASDVQASAYLTECRYLSGIDKDSEVMWDFMCTSGRGSGRWTRIKVPSCWETQGFGNYYYGWEEPFGSDETGYYRHCFKADRSWRGSHVDIVFEGSMTDTEVKLNGRLVGPVHEGGFYRFRYDISDCLRYGADNTLEVKVTKCPADSSIYRAERQTDFWLFGGIYRPVYLEIKPRVHFVDMAVDARADGTLRVRPCLSGASDRAEVSVYVATLDGRRVSEPVTARGGEVISTVVEGIVPWSHERPQLYRVVAELHDRGQLRHRITDRIGFRTVEFRAGDGLYLNGRRIIFKGVNRHCFWPESGRTLSRDISLADARLIKAMNMNAVRMSHYPPDKEFLEICDSIGLLVIDELCSWQKRYDAAPAHRIAREVVERDRNHPSVVLWANGNEGGWNTEVDDDYRKYDLQQRFVIHPWERFRGTDTKHYPDYNYVVNSMIYDRDIYFPTEFMHGIFDGGAAASLSDFWDVMMRHRAPAGGFLWALLDEGLVRADRNDSIDCRFDLAPDGIVGPYREKEGSFYAVRQIWSPVRVTARSIPEGSDVTVAVENDYMFTDLSECGFTYELADVARRPDGTCAETVAARGSVESPACAPGERRMLTLELPEGWDGHDILRLTVTSPQGAEVYTYSWPIGTGDRLQRRLLGEFTAQRPEVTENDSCVCILHGGNRYTFDRATGRLDSVVTPRGRFSLTGVPKVATSDNDCTGLNYYRDGDAYCVVPRYKDGRLMRWVFAPGEPLRLDYSFSVSGEADFIGVGLDYPEEKVLAMEWVGEGPYRVWKNRMEGTAFGCHRKTYNNTVTGESWLYPEFKGCYADCRAVTVNTTEGSVTFIPSRSGLFFQMLAPQAPCHDGNGYTMARFPDSSFGFMHAIAPVGTKFQHPDRLGPSGQKNMQLNYYPFSGSVWILL